MAAPRLGHRVVLLGDQGVGKSSIAHRFVHREFLDNSAPTIGAAYLVQSVKVGDKTIKLDIWDTAGQERFSKLAPMYYRTAQAAVVAYDICCQRTFERAMEWVEELRTNGPPTIAVILCGNKVDRAVEEREVSAEEASRVAKEKGMLFMEASAKTGMAVDEIFTTIAKILTKDCELIPQKGQTVQIDRANSQSKCICSS